MLLLYVTACEKCVPMKTVVTVFPAAISFLVLDTNNIFLLLQSVLPQQLDRHTVGYLTYKGGTYSSINATVVRETEQS